MPFESARAVADAVLLEGYVLYPYRASAAKNRYRWTFGVVAPGGSNRASSEPTRLSAQCLVQGSEPSIQGRLRFLHVKDRRVERFEGDRAVETESLRVGAEQYVAWQEGELRELDFASTLPIDGGERAFPFAVPGEERREAILDDAGRRVGSLVFAQSPLDVMVRLTSEAVLRGTPPTFRLSLSVENHASLPANARGRPDVMRCSLASAHVLLSVNGGSFVSLLDPPPEHAEVAKSCRADGLYPVLVGRPGSADLVLLSPIILEDYAAVAPESPGDFFDATEIDEMLTLRTLTLTPEEKALARATDARSRALVDRVEAMSESQRSRLHAVVRADAEAYAPGGRVRLRPGVRRTDAQDLLFSGRAATIARVEHDVDGHALLAVTIDDDPMAELHGWQGRYQYYHLDEVEPLDEEIP